MAIKNDVKAIKQEFENDEKILANAFLLERFFKKYKYSILVIVLAILAWVGYANIYEWWKQKEIKQISEIYTELLASPNNEVLRKNLKEKAPNLYDLFMYAEFNRLGDIEGLKELRDSKNELVRRFVSYEIASFEQDKDKLHSIDSAFKDFAKLQEAYIFLKKDDIESMRKVLDSIKDQTRIYSLAQMMRHYGITKIPLESQMIIEEVTSDDKKQTIKESKQAKKNTKEANK